MKVLSSLSIIIMLALSGAPLAQQTTGSFKIGGQTRDYILYVPTGVSRAPLVINMHGLGSNASQQLLYTQFNKIADREKCIVVYPNAINNSWDLSGSVDVNFLLALIDTISARHSIDPSRVYCTGMSMGGYMSHKMGCQCANRIAAIASVTGLNVLGATCKPSRAMPVLQIHGTADNTVPYSGVAATIDLWVTKNGCPKPAALTSPYPSTKPSSKVRKETYGPCNQGSEVTLLTVEGAGHIWPGGAGAVSDINASEEVWAFLKRFSLPVSTLKSTPRSALNQTIGVRFGSGNLLLSNSEEVRTVRILDVSGRSVRWWNVAGIAAQETSLPFAGTPGSVYLIEMCGEDGLKNIRSVIGQ